jgi:hypothetical protein
LRKNRHELKILKKILLVIGILAIIGFTIILDIVDRGKVYSKNITINELNEFYLNKNQEERKSAFEKHFGFGKNHSNVELKSFVEITQVWNFSKFMKTECCGTLSR